MFDITAICDDDEDDGDAWLVQETRQISSPTIAAILIVIDEPILSQT
jgi:hypothetical protein